MTDWPPEIKRKIDYINQSPYSESHRFVRIIGLMGDLAKEASIAAGMTGMNDLLTQIIEECAAWLEMRRGEGVEETKKVLE